MIKPRFELRKGSKKEKCPRCHRRSFKPYFDNESQTDLVDGSGRCDHESSCGYNQPPAKPASTSGAILEPWQPQKPARKHVPVFIPDEMLRRLESHVMQAGFLQNLIHHVDHPWPADEVAAIAKKYRCGSIPATSSDQYAGAIAFPFIDENGKTHSIQLKTFDQTNHTTGQNWIHSYLRFKKYGAKWLDDYEKQKDLAPLTRCLFGAHLIPDSPPDAIIAIVEAPKTAIICDYYFRDQKMIWLAAGALSWLKVNRCGALMDRRVILFPDSTTDGSTFEKWKSVSDEIKKNITSQITTSDLMEKLADEVAKSKGYDLADVLLQHDWRAYKKGLTRPIERMKAGLTPLESMPPEQAIKELESMAEKNPHVLDLIRQFQAVIKTK
jgi:hypothetical protein